MEEVRYKNDILLLYANKSVAFHSPSAFIRDENILLDELEQCYYNSRFEDETRKTNSYTVLRNYISGKYEEKAHSNPTSINVGARVKQDSKKPIEEGGVRFTKPAGIVNGGWTYCMCIPFTVCKSAFSGSLWSGVKVNDPQPKDLCLEHDDVENDSDMEINAGEAITLAYNNDEGYGAIPEKLQDSESSNLRNGYTAVKGDVVPEVPEQATIDNHNRVDGQTILEGKDKNSCELVKRAFLVLQCRAGHGNLSTEEDETIRKSQYNSIKRLYPSLGDGITKSRVMKCNVTDWETADETIVTFLNGIAANAMLAVVLFNGHQNESGSLCMANDEPLKMETFVSKVISAKDSGKWAMPHVVRIVLPGALRSAEVLEEERGDVHVVMTSV